MFEVVWVLTILRSSTGPSNRDLQVSLLVSKLSRWSKERSTTNARQQVSNTTRLQPDTKLCHLLEDLFRQYYRACHSPAVLLPLGSGDQAIAVTTALSLLLDPLCLCKII